MAYDEWAPGFVPWRHQVDGLELLRKHDCYALFDDVGCGKTAPLAMRMGELLREAKETNPKAKGLILAEQPLLAQWPKEFMRFNPDLTAGRITGSNTAKEKREFWYRVPDVIVTNYEYVKSILPQLKALIQGGNLIVVVADEMHKLGGYRGPRAKQGKQSARIIHLTRDIPYRYGGTASPVSNPDSSRVWALLNFLNPSLLPPTISMFERIFYDNFSPTYRYKQLKLKPAMKEELSRVLRTVSRRVLLEDTEAEVPERIEKDVYVEMSPKLRKFYRSLREHALAEHEGRTISRAEVLSRNFALLQVASGWVIDTPDPLEVMACMASGEVPPDKQVIHIDSSHKDDALRAICEEIGPDAKLIVWAHFTHEIDHLHKKLQEWRGKNTVARVDGSVTGAKRDRAIIAFTESKKVNTYLGQPGAGGAGLNLQVAQYMVRYSRSHFIIHHEQSIGRNKRAVRDQFFKRIIYWSLMTDATVDVRTEMRNRGKREFAGEILLEHLSYEERNA